MEFQQVVARRRMVRHFSPEPIDLAVLERIGLTAQRTPSAGFSQGQRLVVVTDEVRRRTVADICGERFYVDRRVIVPRSHIAFMLKDLPAPKTVLDIRTSGTSGAASKKPG